MKKICPSTYYHTLIIIRNLLGLQPVALFSCLIVASSYITFCFFVWFFISFFVFDIKINFSKSIKYFACLFFNLLFLHMQGARVPSHVTWQNENYIIHAMSLEPASFQDISSGFFRGLKKCWKEAFSSSSLQCLFKVNTAYRVLYPEGRHDRLLSVVWTLRQA